jgi:hypothetical protein
VQVVSEEAKEKKAPSLARGLWPRVRGGTGHGRDATHRRQERATRRGVRNEGTRLTTHDRCGIIVGNLPSYQRILWTFTAEVASMVANRDSLQELADGCIALSGKAEDPDSASELLRISYPLLQLADPTPAALGKHRRL